MYGYIKVLHIITICICITFGTGTQVDAYYNDVSDPTKVELEEWHQRKPRLAERAGYDLTLGCDRPSMYICEEPEDVVPVDNTKTCNYRSVRYHEQVFRWVAGRGCLFYTPDFLYIGGNNNFNLSVACLYGDLFAPCLEMAKPDGTCGCFPFDPALQEVARAVRKAIIPAAHGRWERCFYAAADCCSHHMSEAVPSSSRCDSTFDGWTCWDETDADTVSSKVCSEFAYSNSGPTCHHYSTKQCHQNGTWELQTDYSTCSISPRLVRRYRFHIAVLSFSIAACLPAVFIFFSYKRLRVTRVALHRNLLIVIIVRNILVIVSRSAIYIDELTNSGDTVMSSHGYPCRILAVAERFAANCVFVAMLVEGIYLHRTIVAVFKKKLKVAWLYGLGAVIAIIPALVWAIIMGLMNNHSCWVVYTVEHIQWILDGPRVTILLVNTALFIDVLRVLLTKIRNSENANQLSTTKATLFLMPLFGSQFLLTAFRPTTTDCTGEQIYFYVSYTVEGLQGFIVALLYCYVNKEVHMLMKATYKKTESAVVSAIRGDSSYHRPSNGKSDRRLTCTTGLPSHHDEKEHNCEDIKPKLHVAEIISIQATEKLAEILEPIYETVQTGIVNEGFNSERVHAYASPIKYPKDDYYAFTNASSISIDCHDWIKCVSSPSSSLYNNSLNEYETKYLERKFPNHPKLEDFIKARDKKFEYERAVDLAESDKTHDDIVDTRAITPVSDNIATAGSDCGVIEEEETMPQFDTSLDEAIEDVAILEEIMQYIDKCDQRPVTLEPTLLCPNRKEEDKVVFVDD